MWTNNSPATRRSFLSRSAGGVGMFALAHLLQREGLLAADAPGKPGENLPSTLRPRAPHHGAKANARRAEPRRSV